MSKRWIDFILDAVAYILVIGFIVLLVHFLCGCSPKYITVPEYHYESHHTKDTIIEKDTVLNERNTIIREADSSMLVGLGIRLKEGERAILVLRNELQRVMNQQKTIKHDTIVQCDSIRVPYPVEKKLSRWQRICISYGGFAIGIAIALFLILVILLYYRFKKLRRTGVS